MIIKLETNIPLVGQLSYCDFEPGKPWTDPKTQQTKMLPDQIRLKGDFQDFEGDSLVYLPLDLGNDLVQLGIVQMVDGNGARPSYNVVSRDRVVITKKEDGKKRFTTVERQNGNSAPTSGPTTSPAGISQHSAQPATDTDRDRDVWKLYRTRMIHAYQVAQQVHTEVEREDGVDATAHSLFIQASRDGLS